MNNRGVFGAFTSIFIFIFLMSVTSSTAAEKPSLQIYLHTTGIDKKSSDALIEPVMRTLKNKYRFNVSGEEVDPPYTVTDARNEMRSNDNDAIFLIKISRKKILGGAESRLELICALFLADRPDSYWQKKYAESTWGTYYVDPEGKKRTFDKVISYVAKALSDDLVYKMEHWKVEPAKKKKPAQPKPPAAKKSKPVVKKPDPLEETKTDSELETLLLVPPRLVPVGSKTVPVTIVKKGGEFVKTVVEDTATADGFDTVIVYVEEITDILPVMSSPGIIAEEKPAVVKLETKKADEASAMKPLKKSKKIRIVSKPKQPEVKAGKSGKFYSDFRKGESLQPAIPSAEPVYISVKEPLISNRKRDMRLWKEINIRRPRGTTMLYENIFSDTWNELVIRSLKSSKAREKRGYIPSEIFSFERKERIPELYSEGVKRPSELVATSKPSRPLVVDTAPTFIPPSPKAKRRRITKTKIFHPPAKTPQRVVAEELKKIDQIMKRISGFKEMIATLKEWNVKTREPVAFHSVLEYFERSKDHFQNNEYEMSLRNIRQAEELGHVTLRFLKRDNIKNVSASYTAVHSLLIDLIPALWVKIPDDSPEQDKVSSFAKDFIYIDEQYKKGAIVSALEQITQLYNDAYALFEQTK